MVSESWFRARQDRVGKGMRSKTKAFIWEDATYVARADRWCLLFFTNICASYMA